MKNKQIKCFQCGKIIGEYIFDGGMNSPLGYIPSYIIKMDYRKAAHLGARKGHVCKTCARKVFTEGKSYSVNFMYHGRETAIDGNSGYFQKFTTKTDAQAACDRMNNKHIGYYWIEEHKL